MATRDKWYFSKEELENTPSRRCGYDSQKELSYRQQAANFIQDMGQRLKVTQLCINTAIVYMHRFYVFHSFSNFLWHHMAAAALFLAAKVEEQPRKLEYVIRIANACRNSKDTVLDVTSEKYLAQSQDLVFNENVLLQTLGFDVAIDHPHTHVVRCCQLVRASKDLAQTSYFMASNSLHLTTMCLQYKPTVVACFCIHLASKWSSWEIPLSSEQKEWFSYVDPTVTAELLQQLTEEFLVIFESSPSRLKEKIIASENQSNNPDQGNFTMDDLRKGEAKDPHGHRSHDSKNDDSHKGRSSRPHDPNSLREREYRERKERERLAAQQHGSKLSSSSSGQKLPPHGHHRHPVDPNKYKSASQSHSRPPSSSTASVPPYPGHRVESRDAHREVARDSSFGGVPHSRDSHHGKELVRDPQQVRGEKDKRDYLLKHNSNDTNSLANKYMAGYVPEKHRSSSVDPNVTDKHRSSSSHADPNVMDKHRSSLSHIELNMPDKHRSLPSHVDLNISDKNRSSLSHVDSNVTDKNRSSSVDLNRPPRSMDTSKVPSGKHDQVRRTREEVKPLPKNESDHIKKHLNSSAYYVKPTHSTSQKVNSDPVKSSVLKQSSNSSSHLKSEKPHHHNGNNSNSFDSIYSNSNFVMESEKVKTEAKVDINEKIPTPQVVKRPSLFSPTDTPPKENSTSLKTNSTNKKEDLQSPSTAPITFMPLGESSMGSIQRNAEPELRPVMKKIDEIEGYENILTSSSIGVGGNVHLDTPGLISPIRDKSLPPGIKEEKNVATTQLVNGADTNPEVISNLLKETPSILQLSQPLEPQVVQETVIQNVEQEKKEKEHHHKSKKKNKEKHKHKDKDKEKEKDKEKKKKHKDKDRDRHKHKDKQNETNLNESNVPSEPKVVLKLPKSKIQNTLPSSETTATSPPSLKIRIPKDVIKTENSGELSQPVVQPNSVGGFKIKIPKDIINNCSSGDSSSRKRERERNSTDGPPAKAPKTGVKEKQNGRHSYNKVHLGDNDLLQNRLAESKYTKTSSS